MADQGEERLPPAVVVESTPLLLAERASSSPSSSAAAAADGAKLHTAESVEKAMKLEESGRDGSPEEAGKKEAVAGTKPDDYYRMGRYMYVVCLLAQMLLLVEVGDLLFMTYAGAAPTVTSCGNYIFSESQKPDVRCAKLEEMWKNGSGALYGCDQKSVNLSYQFESINIEFDQLYCKSADVKLTISLQMIGIIPGSILFGWLSDAYGRRLVMLSALLCWVCSMLATSFVSTLAMFTVFRFIVCFFNAGIAVTLIVFTSELYPKKQRFCLMNLITWAPNYIFFGIIAYFFPNWRVLQRVLAIAALPCIALILFLDESPRFLISARKIEEAKRAILRMHKIDGRHCDEKELDEILQQEHRQMIEQSATKKKYNYFHLFYSIKFALYTVAVSFSLLVVTLITYGLIYNMDKLSGSLYLNMVLMGAFKYTMNLAIAFADLQFKWLGRKMSHLISEVLVVAALGLFVFLQLTGINLPFLSNASLIAAVGFCGVLFNADKLAGSELFPTGVRNLSCSFGQVCSRVGVVLAPVIIFLKDVCSDHFCSVLPHLTLIALAVIDALFFHFAVHETKGHPLISEFPSRKSKRQTLTADE